MMLSMLMEDGVSCDKGGKADTATGICGSWTLEYATWAKTLGAATGVVYAVVATGIGGCWKWEILALTKLVAVASAEFGAVGIST
jgi:hypothetical protein